MFNEIDRIIHFSLFVLVLWKTFETTKAEKYKTNLYIGIYTIHIICYMYMLFILNLTIETYRQSIDETMSENSVYVSEFLIYFHIHNLRVQLGNNP